MSLPLPKEVEIFLVCPACKHSLQARPSAQNAICLRCKHCNLDYPVIDGIPVLIMERATRVSTVD